MRIKWYRKALKQSFNINQAKTSTVTHQSKRQSNAINQIYNKKQSTKHNQKKLSKTIKTQSKTINNHN